MGKPTVYVDTKELDRFSETLKNISDKKVSAFLEKCAKELAKRVLSRTIKKTPRDTSNLARGWRAGGAKGWADSAKVERRGKNYIITISNPVEYSVYVEYGHRTRGPHNPDNPHKTKETSGWVPGFFMLTLSIEEVDKMKEGLLSQLLDQFLKELFL